MFCGDRVRQARECSRCILHSRKVRTHAPYARRGSAGGIGLPDKNPAHPCSFRSKVSRLVSSFRDFSIFTPVRISREGTRYTSVMRHRDFLYACFGGTLLGIGFVVLSLWFLSPLSFVPFLFAVLGEAKSTSRLFSLGLVFGFVAYGLSFSPTFW